jgi:hypothetical protein
MGQVSVTGGLTDVQLRASAVTIGGTVTVGNFPASQAVTFGAVTGSVSVLNFPASQAVTFTDASLTNTQLRASAVTVGGTVTVGNSLTISSLPPISGSVIVTDCNAVLDGAGNVFGLDRSFPVSGTVTLGAGTAQIGSVTASISGTVTANTFALQGTAVTTSNFTSTTASTVLANYNATREVLTIFNEGAGNLHICAGATCTTIAYQVRLSAGDYYEVPNHQTTITHSAVFATAGTARVTQVS